MLADEAGAIYDMVKSRLEANKAELTHLEEAVADQMSTKQPKKRRKKVGKKTAKKGDTWGAGGSSSVDDELLGELPEDINLDNLESSDSDD
jgi:hypothetical protein